jgi:hypothetical protein
VRTHGQITGAVTLLLAQLGVQNQEIVHLVVLTRGFPKPDRPTRLIMTTVYLSVERQLVLPAETQPLSVSVAMTNQQTILKHLDI